VTVLSRPGEEATARIVAVAGLAVCIEKHALQLSGDTTRAVA